MYKDIKKKKKKTVNLKYVPWRKILCENAISFIVFKMLKFKM